MPESSEDRRDAEPFDAAARLAELAPRLGQALAAALGHQVNAVSGKDYSVIDFPGVVSAFGRVAFDVLREPQKVIDAHADLVQRNMAVFERHFLGGAGRNQGEQRRPDRRFKDKAWSEEPVFGFFRESYLHNADWLLGVVRGAEDLSRLDRRKAEFYTRQLLSALSPANFPLTNPQALKLARDTGGESLLKGLENLIRDLEKGAGRLAISQTDADAFEVGRNLATTPGKVVYRNDLIELIQYQPSTEQVFKRPFLFVPPWINKYYILDLRPENSFFKWLVDQGHTVFVISWVNPGSRHAGKSFEDYLREGPLDAVRVVQEITGEPEVNLGAFCIGGILAVCMLAYLWAKGVVPIRSATLLTTMVDMEDVGEASVFIDEPQVASIEKHARAAGYLDGRHMQDMFSMLRENDLIWNYVVNNYLLGRDPIPFDILYWNSDCTRLPARMLTDYLRDVCLANALARPGGLTLGGVPIDVDRIYTPCYVLSTSDDHIAPWRSTYPATQRFSGPVQFVLGGSGHIAGVVNPPTRTKYGYATRDDYPSRADDWLAGADRHEGSWWPHWARWLARHGGAKVSARAPGSDAFPALDDAPGTYVRQR